MSTIPEGTIAAGLISIAFGIACAAIRHRLIDKANERRPNDQQFSYFGEWSDLIFFKEKCYRQSYPDGRLRIWFAVCSSCSFLSFLAAVWIDRRNIAFVGLGLVILVVSQVVFFAASRPSRQ